MVSSSARSPTRRCSPNSVSRTWASSRRPRSSSTARTSASTRPAPARSSSSATTPTSGSSSSATVTTSGRRKRLARTGRPSSARSSSTFTDDQSRVSELQSGQAQFIQSTPGVFYKQLGKDSAPGRQPDLRHGSVPADQREPVANERVEPCGRAHLRWTASRSVIEVDRGRVPGERDAVGQGHDRVRQAAIERKYPHDPAKAAETCQRRRMDEERRLLDQGRQEAEPDITATRTSPTYPLLAQAIQGNLQGVASRPTCADRGPPRWTRQASRAHLQPDAAHHTSPWTPTRCSFWFNPALPVLTGATTTNDEADKPDAGPMAGSAHGPDAGVDLPAGTGGSSWMRLL